MAAVQKEQRKKSGRKMSEVEAEDFFDELEGQSALKERFTIPKKSKQQLEAEEEAARLEAEKEEEKNGNVEESLKKRPAAGEQKVSPSPKRRKAASEFLESDASLISLPVTGLLPASDPLGLEHARVPTYGEVRGTVRNASDLWKDLYGGRLPREVDSQCTDSNCHLCDVELNSHIHARAHYCGKPHEKKAKKFLEDWVAQDPDNRQMPAKLQEAQQAFYENRPDHDPHYCDTCGVTHTSLMMATAHYQGKGHAKQLRKLGGHVPPSNSNKSLGGQEAMSGSGNRFFCMPCQLHFKDSREYECHMYSSEHKMAASSADQQWLWQCAVCRIQFPTQNQYNEHMSSYEHKAKAARVNTGMDVDQLLSQLRDNPNSALKCQVCNIQCTGKSMLEQHLAGKVHRKKLELNEQLTSNPHVLFCQLCNVRMTDKNGLDLHYNGKKHQKKANQAAQK